MPERCTETTYAPDASGTVVVQKQCFNPLQFQVTLYLVLAFAILISVVAWKNLKT